MDCRKFTNFFSQCTRTLPVLYTPFVREQRAARSAGGSRLGARAHAAAPVPVCQSTRSFHLHLTRSLLAARGSLRSRDLHNSASCSFIGILLRHSERSFEICMAPINSVPFRRLRAVATPPSPHFSHLLAPFPVFPAPREERAGKGNTANNHAFTQV